LQRETKAKYLKQAEDKALYQKIDERDSSLLSSLATYIFLHSFAFNKIS